MTNASAATLIDLLRRAPTAQPTVGSYDRHTRSFNTVPLDDLLDRAAVTAEALMDRGLATGQPVMVVAAAPEALWRGYLAAVLAGGLPVLLPIRPTFDSRPDIERKLAGASLQLPGAVLLVQASASGPCIDPGGREWVPLPVVDGRGAAEQPPGGPGAQALLDRLSPASGDPLHLQFTSGSTGDGKPVVVTHANALANVASLIERTHIEPSTNLVCWLPLYHDLGLVCSALMSVIAPCNLRLLSPFDFLADPTHWLTAISLCPDAVTSAPTFALDQVTRRFDPAKLPGLDLSGWRICFSGAEPVDPATVARFIERFAPSGLRSDVVRPGYGLAEATLMVSVTLTGDEPRVVAVPSGAVPVAGPIEVKGPWPVAEAVAGHDPAHALVTCLGPPAPDLTVTIVDPQGCPVSGDDVCGEVTVSGPSVSPGYRRPDGSIDAFPGGRCATGDIGFFHQGELYLVERVKNIIIRHGQNHSASFYEQQLARWAGVPLDRCAVVQTSLNDGRVAAVIEDARRGSTGDLVAAARRVTAELDLPIDEILLVGRNGIPRTTSGKKQHARLRAGLQQGSIAVLDRLTIASAPAPSGAEDVIDLDRLDDAGRVLELVDRHARRRGWAGGPIGEHHHLRVDLGFDSLGLVELAVELEAVLVRAVPERIVNEVDTVGSLVEVVLDDSQADSSITAALTDLALSIPQIQRRVDVQLGRQLCIDGRWVTDFASVNYLGLDLHPEVMAAIGPMVERWGVHPSWTRAVASPAPYPDLERGLARAIGAPDVIVFPTITLAHIGVLPLLATRHDTLIVDRTAHHSVHEGASLAGARGATLRWFDHGDPGTLRAALDGGPGRPVVALNGVYSMTGTVPDLVGICEVVADHGGLVYVDDAHGFGVLGRDPSPTDPYGSGGGGVAAHLGLDYEHLVYVAGLSKAYSSMAAFVSCRDDRQRALFERASTAIFSGPVPVASLASALAGLAVNDREGDELRRRVHQLTSRIIEGVRARGYAVDNPLAVPIVNLVLGDVGRTVAASQVMWDHGILFTPSVFPAAPLDRSGFRISVTSANTDDDVDRLLDALDAVERTLGPPPSVSASWIAIPDA